MAIKKPTPTTTTPDGNEVTQKRDAAAQGVVDAANIPPPPAGKEERRCYQVTKGSDGRVTGTVREWLTKEEALKLGFPWSEEPKK